MTPRQKEVFDFIQSYISNRGIAPTYEEIIQATNIGYKSYLHRVLKNLKEQGKIEITSYKARGISICKGTVREKEQIKRLQKQLEIAVRALEDVATFMTCDEVEIQEIQPDFCADQAALDRVNEAMKKIKKLNK